MDKFFDVGETMETVKNIDCPGCKAGVAGNSVPACLCTVTSFFCDDCLATVLANYSCAVCSSVLPVRCIHEINVTSYVGVVKSVMQKNG